MTRTIPESDWRLFRQLRTVALDRFCEQVLADIADIVGDTKVTPHERYVRIYKIVQQRDRTMAEAFDNPRRSTAIMQLLVIASHGLITKDEIERFTQETREVISRFGTQRG